MAFKITLPSRGKRAKKQVLAKKKPQSDVRPRLDLVAQFRGADWRNPAALPPAPKLLLCVLVAGVGLLLVWLALVRGQLSLLEAKQKEEEKLKTDFIEKTTKVANLGPLLQQRHQAEEYVTQLEKQLPGKSEMASLLSDINQAGVGRNLQFELFKPGNEEVKAYYAQLPVSIRVSGRFPEIAAFAADIAQLSRIVTLGNMNIGARKDAKDSGNLIMEATANTYRYLDKSEKLANTKDTQDAKKKSASKGGES
jgi:type IV pilus assembly protein PilO